MKLPRRFILDLALGAGNILKRYYNKQHKIIEKKGEGIVTEADLSAESFVTKKILKAYPSSSIIAEESGRHQGKGELCWYIDPLDGTSNYAHGFPWFCVSIAVYENGKPLQGVIYHPITNELFYAAKGQGAFLKNKRLKVTKQPDLTRALLGTGFYYSKGPVLAEEMRLFHRMNEEVLAVRRPGSAALDLAMLACGRYDGFWERGLKPWDVAAGFILVEEAGGKISDYSGNSTDVEGGEVLASNGKIHSRMMEVLSKN